MNAIEIIVYFIKQSDIASIELCSSAIEWFKFSQMQLAIDERVILMHEQIHPFKHRDRFSRSGVVLDSFIRWEEVSSSPSTLSTSFM